LFSLAVDFTSNSSNGGGVPRRHAWRTVCYCAAGFLRVVRKRGIGDMTDNSVSQTRASFSRAVGALIAALVVLSAAEMGVAAHRRAPFVAIDLGTIGGNTSEASAVNARGVVVGRSSIDDTAAFHAFAWSERTGMIDLGTPRGDTQAWAIQISDSGVIAGIARASSDKPFHAFVWTHSNGFADPSLGGPNSGITAINARGDVVGFSDSAGDPNSHAFLWTARDRTTRDLGTLGGRTSNANAISDSGIVVGDSLTAGNVPHAFMWTRHSDMVDLGTLGTPDLPPKSSSAQAVSDDGVIVGFSQTDQTGSNNQAIKHAFVWTHRNGMVDIGTTGLDSFGEKIVGLDTFVEKITGRFVVGHLTIPTSPTTSTTHGFVWTQKQGFVDIGTLVGDVGSFVAGVNDRGVVAGNSFTGTGSRAFLWSSGRPVQLPLPAETPAGGSSQAAGMNDDFIVGSSCTTPNVNCHATLWKPAPHSRKDRERDDDD
jgi:probable HAF family extracellular repeat protein